ncbi:Protein kinase rad3 [Leucoagaricus sp. SymC.cos]|nr:Protein kinase rad3 [Leucoagaricus sp. SymC.cos]
MTTNAPSATPFLVPTFNGSEGDASLDHFLDFLRTLVSQYLSDDVPRIPSSNKDLWITIISGLTDHLLSTFPLPNIVSWNALREKIVAIITTLDVVRRAFERVDGIHEGTAETVKKVFARLLNLCFVLDSWLCTEVQLEDGIVEPNLLREKCFQSLVVVLRRLGGNSSTSRAIAEPSWQTLRDILQECLNTCRGKLVTDSPMHLSFPLTISLFGNLIIAETKPVDLFEAGVTNPLEVIVPSAAIAPVYFCTLLQILTHVISPPLLCQWYIVDIVRKTLEDMKSVFGSWVVPCSIIRHRLYEGQKDGWESFDKAATNMLQGVSLRGVSKIDLLDVIKSLCAENWGLQGVDLRTLGYTFLRSALNDFKMRHQNDLLQDLDPLKGMSQYEAVMQIVFTGLSRSSFTQELSSRPLNNDLQMVLQDLGYDHVQQMNRNGEWDQSDIQQIAYALPGQLKRSLHDSSEVTRLNWAKNLTRLPCLVTDCTGSGCEMHKSSVAVLFAKVYHPLIALLLDGTDNEVTAIVRREAFRAVKRAVDHHATEVAMDGLEEIEKFLLQYLRDPDRSARLSVCYALSAVVLAYTRAMANPWHLTQRVFGVLYRHMGHARDIMKETVVIAVGKMGKTKHPDILGQVLCFLIAQLGQQNLVIKGVASIQLTELSRFHHKAPYTLVSPYLDHIAQFLVSKIVASPSLMVEACRFLSMAPSDFIMVTASRTFPRLFASCDAKAVEAVSRRVGQKASTLFLSHSPEILAHIFMLPQPREAEATSFVLKILADASQSEAISLQMIVRLSLVKLLGELVIAMGDESSDIKQLAIGAVTKIERIINSSAKGGNQSPVDLSAFLKTQMLGLVSHVNDMLQDVQGKKTAAVKRKIIRGLGALILQIGPAVTYVAPQIMATFQTMVAVPELSDTTLQSWHNFLITLGPSEVGPHVGPTSAAFVSAWDIFSSRAKQHARESMAYIAEIGGDLGQHLDDVADIKPVPDLSDIHEQLQVLRTNVAVQSLGELKSFLLDKNGDLVRELVSGDIFDPLIGQAVGTLLSAACRDGDGVEILRDLAYECIGILGAVDPDRCELPVGRSRIIVKNNFTDEDESMQFALHLICDLLVGAFRSTSDIKHQSFLAYTIQELLKFCQFKPALVGAGTGTSISNKVRHRWRSLPKYILETVTPLLEGKFTLNFGTTPHIQHPIYLHQSTYREWIQLWTAYLIDKASGSVAQTIFNIFRSAVRNKDAGVAHHLLPHLVLNILIGGSEEDAQEIRTELIVVLEDQINQESNSSPDKKLLSAQAVFMLLDHLNAWVRVVRQDLNAKKADSKRPRSEKNVLNTQLEEQLWRIDSILSSIDHHLMAQAAFRCKAFARSLMNYEQQILSLREVSPGNQVLVSYYERLHEIYAHLDEPDGMEGISTIILSPSLEHQIRQHESMGHWTSAQSCWEVRLQQSPDNVEYHLGLLRCLRNLGHYDTLRTHVRGVLTRKPEWRDTLAGFQIESAWMVGAWDDVQNLVEQSTAQTAQIVTGRVLLAMRNVDPTVISAALVNARTILGSPITAAGPRSYRRSYDAVLDLHLIHELELIHQAVNLLPESSQGRSQEQKHIVGELTKTLATRLESISPTFRFRELALSMRRTAFSLSVIRRHNLTAEIGKTWLASAKIARKAGQWQTAYSAMLQAQQSKAKFSFLESAKLSKAMNEPLRALKELENSMKLSGLLENPADVVDLTMNDETIRMKAKAHVLRTRWMCESQRYDPSVIYRLFQNVTEMDKNSESAHFYLGQFHDEIYKSLSQEEKRGRGVKMNSATIRAFARAVKQGSKYVYQTVPRLLTIWLDMGEETYHEKDLRDIVTKCHETAARAIREIPAYKWYIAFPQIVSRVGHSNPEIFKTLSKLILKVLEEYPKQALWLFTSVVKSTKSNREQRGRTILEQLKNNPRLVRTKIPVLVQQSVTMTNELLALCDYHVDDEKKVLHMRKDFPRLAQIGRCDLIIPLQESLTASLPPASADQATHQPCPTNLPTFHEFFDEIDIMRSLAKPRKISIRGTDDQTYMFLGKPKDDLRKDARLMELNSIINKLLKANSESRKRQLHIRTYGVVTLNEECGFIQWVPNTIPLRPVLLKYYDARRIRSWAKMGEVFRKIKEADDSTSQKLFINNILPNNGLINIHTTVHRFPPVFHEWFLETFPEPSAWLTSRTTYGRTAAVMSMVGFILGLGDRHCENILLDTNTGDVGKTLETPERVPFRLTQNLVDGLGVTGVEGFFRIACEVTLQLLRDNKDSLMSVLDSFIHDPLVEWEDEKRRLDRQRNQVAKTSIDLLAKTALSKIEKKLKGIYVPDTTKDRNVVLEKEVSTNNLVQVLIQESTDDVNLARMYSGWASWH